MKDLAIIIPAFRSEFLAQTLDSLARQDCARFRVYVSDDCSPEDLSELVRPYHRLLDLDYHRFDHNLGAQDLVGHWKRSVERTREPWVWLFSDDDLAGPDCVAAIAEEALVRAHPCDLYRFRTTVVDAAGEAVFEEGTLPTTETATQLYRQLLIDQSRATCLQNHVFSREVYDARGGFVSAPGGWFSDWATWVNFAASSGVKLSERGRVFYRRHAASISGNVGSNVRASRAARITGAQIFIRESRHALQAPPETRDALEMLEMRWFNRMVQYLPSTLRVDERDLARRFLKELFPRRRFNRELLFWSAWSRPFLRKQRALARLSGLIRSRGSNAHSASSNADDRHG